jgi:hypothetical protein
MTYYELERIWKEVFVVWKSEARKVYSEQQISVTKKRTQTLSNAK